MAIFINELGNQGYFGTEAEYDQVDYAGSLSDYRVTQNTDGSVSVFHPELGLDTLLSIEGFWFQGEQRWYSLDEALSLQPETPINPGPTDPGTIAPADLDFIAIAGQSNGANMFNFLDGDRRDGNGADALEAQITNLTGFNAQTINAAYGATGSNETANPDFFWWNLAEGRPGQILLDSVADIQRSLAAGGDLDALVWSQGESDAYEMFFGGGDPEVLVANMVEATTLVFEYFRAEFGQDLPIFITEMGEFEVPRQLAPGEANAFDLVRDAQLAMAESDPNIFMGADTTGLPYFTDGIHFTTDSYQDIGVSLADTIVSVLGDNTGTTPVIPPVEPPVEPPVPPNSDVITGTVGNDRLNGTSGDDVFESLVGSDVVISSAGNDTVSLGDGYDQVDYSGGAADYTFVREADGSITVTKPDGGIDTLNGIDGIWFQGDAEWAMIDDLVTTITQPPVAPPTNPGVITGTNGDDQLIGTDGDDVFQSTVGSDMVVGSLGDDAIILGDGYDQVNYDGAASDYTIVRNNDGSLSVTKPGGAIDTLVGVDGFWFQGEGAWYSADAIATIPNDGEAITGTDGDDRLFGTDGDDVIDSLIGSDVVIGSSGNDIISLGDGFDQIDYAGASADYSFVRNADGSFSVTKPDGSIDTLNGVDGFWFQGEAAWFSADDASLFDALV